MQSESERMVIETFEKQLKKMQAIGMSYGSKIIAQTLHDIIKSYYITRVYTDVKIDSSGMVSKETLLEYDDSIDFQKLSDNEKSELLIKVFNVVNNTLDVSIDGIAKSIESIKKSNNKLLNNSSQDTNVTTTGNTTNISIPNSETQNSD